MVAGVSSTATTETLGSQELRTQQIVTIETDPKKNNGNVTYGDPEKSTGITREHGWVWDAEGQAKGDSLEMAVKPLLGLTSCHEEKRRPSRYLIPDGYVGWVRIDYKIKEAPALPIEDGFYLKKLPRTDVFGSQLLTSMGGPKTNTIIIRVAVENLSRFPVGERAA